MLKTISELDAEGAERFLFPRGNEIPYSMDFRGHAGVPTDRVFYKREEFNGMADLVADGFGARGNYGNGSIFVSLKNMPAPIRD